MHVGEVVCDLPDTHVRIICPVRDIAHVRNVPVSLPLNCTASDGKLGKELEMMLHINVVGYKLTCP